MKISILEKQKIVQMAKKYKLRLLLLFGSQLEKRKFLHKESDFDIAYLSKGNLDLMDEAKLICDLMSIFRTNKIDLVNIKKAAPLLLFEITNNCQVLYQENSLLFPAFRVYAFKRYVETKPLYEEKFRRLKRRIEKIKL